MMQLPHLGLPKVRLLNLHTTNQVRARRHHGPMLMIAAVLALGLVFVAAPAYADTRYIEGDGTDTGTCDTPATSCATITYAVSKSNAGDELKVASGIYTEAGDISVNKGVTITGGFNVNGATMWESTNFTSTPTILDGGNAHRVVSIDASKVTLQFLTIRNGDASNAGANADVGGGIAVNSDAALLRSLTVINNVGSSDNATGTGGAIAFTGAGEWTIERSVILSNTTVGLGGGIGIRPGSGQKATLHIESTLIARNGAANGGAIAASGAGQTIMVSEFTTIADNAAGAATEAIYLTEGVNDDTKTQFLNINYMLAAGNSTIINSTAQKAPNIPVSGLLADDGFTTPYAGNVPNSTIQPIIRNITFVNPPKGDYHLPKGSPAIDLLGNTGKVDLEGRKRNAGQTNCTPFSLCPLGRGDDFGAYEYVYKSTSLRYVATEGDDSSNNCLNPELPCKTLGLASSLALGGDEIRVARGIYTTPDSTTLCNSNAIICINQGITVTGGLTLTNWITPSTNPLLTVLDGGGQYRGIRIIYNVPSASSRIRNFTVRNGYSNQDGGGIAIGTNADPTHNLTINNCRVEQNRAGVFGDGGGIFANEPSNLRISNCVISGNFVADGRGGGIAIDDASGTATYTLSSLLVFSNTASRPDENSANGGMGGGVFLQGVGTLQQSEVYSNVAVMSGGGVTTGSNNSNPTIDRVYIHDNKASVGGGYSIFLTGGATLQNSLLVRNAATSTVGILNNQINQPFLGGNAIHSPYVGVPTEPLNVINVTIADNTGAVEDAIKVEGLADPASSRRNFFTNVLISGNEIGILSDGKGFAELNKVLMTSDVVTPTTGFTGGRLTGPSPLTGARGFADATAGDYHLLSSAAGVDQGVTVDSRKHDLDGVPRPVGPAYDIGAYETTKEKKDQTITFAGIPNHALADSPVPVNATASSNLPVQIKSTTPAVCTINAFSVTLVGEGTCVLEATQPGNAEFNAAPKVTRSFVVTIDPPESTILLPSLKKQP